MEITYNKGKGGLGGGFGNARDVVFGSNPAGLLGHDREQGGIFNECASGISGGSFMQYASGISGGQGEQSVASGAVPEGTLPSAAGSPQNPMEALAQGVAQLQAASRERRGQNCQNWWRRMRWRQSMSGIGFMGSAGRWAILPRDAFGRHAKKPADMQEWLSEMHKLCGRCLRLAVQDAKLCGRCLRLAVRDAKTLTVDICGWLSEMQKTLRPMFAVGCPRCKKTLRPMFAVGCPRCKKTLWPMFAVGCPRCKKLCGRCLLLASDAKNSVADVCSWTLRPMFAVGCPRCKNSELRCRCSRLAARDAKNSVADVCGRLPEMQRRLWPLFAIGCLKCEKFGGR